MKDMLAGLNEMLERRERGEDPQFEEFMERFGDFFPENPQTLDELLEVMAQRMAAMQAMLNSMTPEQRAQLQQLMDQLLEDMDLRWQMDQLGQHLRSQFPQMGWDRSYSFQGMDPLGFSEAVDMMQQLGDIDQLENLMRGSANPGALAEADLDRVRDLLGRRRRPLAGAPGRAGPDAGGGRAHREPGGPAGADAEGHPAGGPERAVGPVHQAGQGQDGPAPDHAHRASGTSAATRARPTSSATRSTSTCTGRSATPSAARARGRRCASRPTTSRSS